MKWTFGAVTLWESSHIRSCLPPFIWMPFDAFWILTAHIHIYKFVPFKLETNLGEVKNCSLLLLYSFAAFSVFSLIVVLIITKRCFSFLFFFEEKEKTLRRPYVSPEALYSSIMDSVWYLEIYTLYSLKGKNPNIGKYCF